ncbi:MAG: ASKHA domain-containing protein [Candidatus Ratteibacteria bacterium]
MALITLFIEPDNLSLTVPEGTLLSDAIEESGIWFPLPCGGAGICGKCEILFLSSAPDPTERESELLGSRIKEGWRLACQTRLFSSSRIRLKEDNQNTYKILSETKSFSTCGSPHITKKSLTLSPITLQNPISLQEEVARAFQCDLQDIPLSVIKDASSFGFGSVTGLFLHNRLFAIEKGDTSSELFGAAVDLGTTTLALTLYDLSSSKELITIVQPNPQIPFGDDIVSRISQSLHGKSETLRTTLLNSLSSMLLDACSQIGLSSSSIYHIVLSGNSVMEEIILDLPLDSLATLPFYPSAKGPFTLSAKEIGLSAFSSAKITLFPILGGFVGGDTAGMIFTTGIHRKEEISLGIDIGTNGEIVLGNKEKILSASTAAGPAFEGGRISMGMRAQKGAVEECHYDTKSKKISYRVINKTDPVGICGSGLIDIVATLLQLGSLSPSGRLTKTEETASHFIHQNSQPAFLLNPEAESPIILTQKDIREFQSAKGAIRTGIELLMQETGFRSSQINKIYLAGALGNYVTIKNLLITGLLPQFEEEKIIPAGNTSLSAALQFLCNADSSFELNHISSITRVVELSTLPNFLDTYTEALLF